MLNWAKNLIPGLKEVEHRFEQSEGSSLITPIAKPFVINITATQNLLGMPFIYFQLIELLNAQYNVTLFNSFIASSKPNFGNPISPVFISVTSAFAGYSYLQFIRDTETHPFRVKKILVESNSNAQASEQSFEIYQPSAEGKISLKPISSPTPLNQYNKFASEFDCDFIINGETRLAYNMLPNTSVTMYFYPDVISELRNAISNKPVIGQQEIPDNLMLYEPIKFSK